MNHLHWSLLEWRQSDLCLRTIYTRSPLTGNRVTDLTLWTVYTGTPFSFTGDRMTDLKLWTIYTGTLLIGDRVTKGCEQFTLVPLWFGQSDLRLWTIYTGTPLIGDNDLRLQRIYTGTPLTGDRVTYGYEQFTLEPRWLETEWPKVMNSYLKQYLAHLVWGFNYFLTMTVYNYFFYYAFKF